VAILTSLCVGCLKTSVINLREKHDGTAYSRNSGMLNIDCLKTKLTYYFQRWGLAMAYCIRPWTYRNNDFVLRIQELQAQKKRTLGQLVESIKRFATFALTRARNL